jgi:CubicO group peptidase (beta-lactamase class C family)
LKFSDLKLYITLLFIFIFLFCSACTEVESKRKNIPEIKSTEINLDVDADYSDQAEKIDKFFRNRHKRGVFNGTVLFAENGSVVYKNAFGYSDFRKKDSLQINSPFQLASVSKPITSFAIMLLEQRGTISYEDTLRKFFPDFPYENITVKNLLTHRSGLPNYMYFADDYWVDRRNLAITNQDVIDLFIEYKPLQYYKPDRRYNYNNTNYCILASIIEKASGMTFEQFVMKEIFEPLDMKDSYIYRKRDVDNFTHKVTGYKRARRIAEDSYLNGVVGDKGIYSTVEDLYKFDQALYNGKLVSTENIKKAFEPAHKDLWSSDNYGFGWRINTKSDSTKIVHHTGWWKGFRSYFIRDLDKKKTIIVLSNVGKYFIGTHELEALFDIEYN